MKVERHLRRLESLRITMIKTENLGDSIGKFTNIWKKITES